jgi:hypothetical protein
MASLVSAAINVLVLIAVSGAVLLTALVLRNPLGPKWLRNEAAAQAAGLVLTAGVCVAISNAVAELVDANIHYSIAVILTGAFFAASSYMLWRAFNVGGRLKRTEAGRSPFAREPRQMESQAPAALEQSAKAA